MLQPHINYQFKSSVWRLEIDPLGEIIFAEIRDSGDRKVYFSAISLDTGKVLFDGLQAEERWLTGIEGAYDGIVLLHNYQSESAPVHKGLTAIDGLTGKTLWSNYTHAFDHLSANGPVIFDTKIQPKKLLLIDIKTGTSQTPYEESDDGELDNHIILPDEMSPELLKSILASISPFGNTVQYLEHNNFRIVSLHTFTEGALQQHLYIMDIDNNIIYQDLLNTDIQKLQPESFLMYKDHLIYLKGQSQLKVLNL